MLQLLPQKHYAAPEPAAIAVLLLQAVRKQSAVQPFLPLPLQKYLYVSKKLVVVFTFGAVQNKLLLLFKCFIIVVDSSAVFCQQCFDTPVQLGFEDRFQNRLAVFRFGDQKPSEFSWGNKTI